MSRRTLKSGTFRSLMGHIWENVPQCPIGARSKNEVAVAWIFTARSQCPSVPPSLQDKFRGCLLGGMLGDIAGAVVEAESPGYIAKTYTSIDDILRTESV